VYSPEARSWPYLQSLGPLKMADRGSKAGIVPNPKELVT